MGGGGDEGKKRKRARPIVESDLDDSGSGMEGEASDSGGQPSTPRPKIFRGTYATLEEKSTLYPVRLTEMKEDGDTITYSGERLTSTGKNIQMTGIDSTNVKIPFNIRDLTHFKKVVKEEKDVNAAVNRVWKRGEAPYYTDMWKHQRGNDRWSSEVPAGIAEVLKQLTASAMRDSLHTGVSKTGLKRMLAEALVAKEALEKRIVELVADVKELKKRVTQSSVP